MIENKAIQDNLNKIKAKLTVEVEAEFYDDESSEETVRYCVEQDLEDAGLDVIDVSVDNTMRNLRVKIEQLIENFENGIGNRNMNDLEQGKYDGYRDILDLLDEMEWGDTNEKSHYLYGSSLWLLWWYYKSRLS